MGVACSCTNFEVEGYLQTVWIGRRRGMMPNEYWNKPRPIGITGAKPGNETKFFVLIWKGKFESHSQLSLDMYIYYIICSILCAHYIYLSFSWWTLELCTIWNLEDWPLARKDRFLQNRTQELYLLYEKQFWISSIRH